LKYTRQNKKLNETFNLGYYRVVGQPAINEAAGIAGEVNGVLRREVERVLHVRAWSLQDAEIATGIPASTINRMRKGLAVKAPTVIRFGLAIGETRDYWAKVALGMEPADSVIGSKREPSPEIVYETDPDFLPVPEGYRDLDETGREYVNETLRVAVEAALRRQRRGGIGYGHDRYPSKPETIEETRTDALGWRRPSPSPD
jgi:hypothetical protein